MTLFGLFSLAGFEGWQLQLDNPTIVGWTVVAFYELAAIACARAALMPRRIGAALWWVSSAGLCFLGINKQLNLQTLLIAIGRHLSKTGGWYGHQRTAQLIFGAMFALGIGIVLSWLIFEYRDFFKHNRLACSGMVVLGLFVALRAATINHVDEFLKINLKDEDWAWVMEIAGSALIGLGALRQQRKEGRQ